MAKYKGKNLSLLIDGEEVNLEATSVVLDNEDADDDTVTFAELAAGSNRQWFFTVSAVADYGADSFHTYLWTHAGEEEVAFIFKPYGNASASAAQPHFTGTLTVPTKPPVGGEAGSTFTFETRLDVDGEPIRDITP